MNRYGAVKTIISIILVTLILGMFAFLAYEIVVVDIFGISDPEDDFFTTLSKIENRIEREESKNNQNSETNNQSENIELVLDQDNLSASETIDTSYLHYYYDQLDETAKIIYKALEDNISELITGTYKIDFQTKFNELLHKENGESELKKAFQSAWNAFTYDHVEVFYIDVTKLVLTTQTTSIGKYATHTVSLSNGESESYLCDGFTYEKLQIETKKLENIRNQVVNALEGYTTYEKIKYVHDWLINNLTYDTTYQGENIHNIYGALVNANVVCEGYARTFKYILDGLEIPCVMISGTATNSAGKTELHAWNDIKIDNKWYAIDLTWDDPIITDGSELRDTSRYKFFLKGANTFYTNHTENGILSEGSIEFEFPKIEKNDYENK